MKKILFMLVALISSLVLVACGNTNNDTNVNEDNQSSNTTDEQADRNDNETENNELDNEETNEQEASDENLTIGDSAEVEGVEFTLVGISTTDERNEFAETNPTQVVKIEYEIVNNTDSEIPIGADLEVYDGTGSKMESYPLDNTLGSLQPGKRIEDVQHFGIEEGPIEIYFAPLISFEDPAIFSAEIE